MKKSRIFLTVALSLIALFAFSAFFAGCGKNGGNGKVEGSFSIAGKPADNELTVGNSVTLIVKAEPENADYEKAEWSVSDDGIATVTDGGVLTAVAAGRCVVTLTVDGKAADNFVLTVLSDKTYVSAIKIENKEGTTLVVGESRDLTITVTPEKHDDEIAFITSDDKVVSVDEDGKITATGEGEATVTVKAVNGDKSDGITVRVVKTEAFSADFESTNYDEAAKTLVGSNFSSSVIEDEGVTVRKEEYKGKAYIELVNAYKNAYHVFAFICNGKYYAGVKYTLAFNVQLIRGASAAGVAICAEADANKKIPTENDDGGEAFNTLLKDPFGLNEVRIEFVCPADTETLYLYFGEANGENIVAFGRLEIIPSLNYEEKPAEKINVYKEEFRFASAQEDGSVVSWNENKEGERNPYFYIPPRDENSLNSVENENGKSALVITNNYTETYIPREMIASFNLEEGKKYSVTIKYTTVRTHNGQFIIKYASDGGEQIGEVLTNGGTDMTDGKVEWTFDAAHDSTGLLVTMADFIGNNELHVSLIEIKEII